MSFLKRVARKIYKITHPELGVILMLHRVVEQRSDSENRELEITPDFLEQSIKDYRQHGYKFVSIDEACDILNRGRCKTPFVCLTFDDGYHDNYSNAWPVLKKEKVPFAIYVTTGFIDNQLPMWWYPNEQLGMSREELLELASDPLCTIGAHTISHPKLDSLNYDEQHMEIEQSKKELESILNIKIDHFSYPHGAYNDDTLSIVKKSAFRSVLMAWGGKVRRDSSPIMIQRTVLKQ